MTEKTLIDNGLPVEAQPWARKVERFMREEETRRQMLARNGEQAMLAAGTAVTSAANSAAAQAALISEQRRIPATLNANQIEIVASTYFDTSGKPWGRLDVSVTPSDLDVDGNPLIPVAYQVWGRVFFNNTSLEEGDRTTIGYGPSYLIFGTSASTEIPVMGLQPGVTYQIRVAAVSAYNVSGALSDYLTATPPVTLEVMEPPSAPTLSSNLGMLVATWDGLMGGALPPSQFRYLHAEVSPAGQDTWLRRGAPLTRGGGSIPISGLTVGQQHDVRLVATDTLNEPTPPSPVSTITVAGVDLGSLDQDVAQALADAEAAAASAAGAASNAIAQAVAAELAANTAAAIAESAQSTADTAVSDAADAQSTADAAASSASLAESVATSAAAIAAAAQAAADSASNAASSAQSTIESAAAAAADAQTAASAAQSAATAAQTAAADAQTTANGKNRIIRSSAAASAPASYQAGDQWWQFSGTQIIAMWLHTGTAWQSQTLTSSVITNLDAGVITAGTIAAARLSATNIKAVLIGAGAIEAENIAAGAISVGTAAIANGAITNAMIADATIQNAKIANLDAAKITAGSLDATRIAARSLTAEKLAIGDFENRLNNPGFEHDLLGWSNNAQAVAATITDPPAGGTKVLRITANGTIIDIGSETIPVVPGDRWYGEVWVRKVSGVDTVGTVQMGLTITGDNGFSVQYPAFANQSISTLVNGTWLKIGGSYQIPAGASRMQVRLSVRNDVADGVYEFDTASLRRMNGGELVVDGSITANKMVAGTITAASGIIADAAITNAKIADATIQNAKIANLDATKITTGTLNADRIGASSITAAKLAAGSVTAAKILVGDFTNLASDGNFLDATKSNWSGTGTVIATAGEPNHLRVVTAASGNNDQANSNLFQVTPGEQIYLEAWVFGANSNVGGGSPNIHLAINRTVGGMTWPGIFATRTEVQGEWTKVSGPVTIPANAISAKVELAVSFSADAVGNVYLFRQVTARRMASGELVVDGSIAANHITAEAITSEKIEAGAVTAGKIAAGAITANEIAAGAITSNEIAARAITADQIDVGQIEVYHLSAAFGAELDISSNEAVNIIAGQLDGISNQVGENGQVLQGLTTYYSFAPEGARISSPGSGYSMLITPEGISISEAGAEVSRWDSGQLIVDSLVGKRVVLGRHQLEESAIGTVVRAL